MTSSVPSGHPHTWIGCGSQGKAGLSPRSYRPGAFRHHASDVVSGVSAAPPPTERFQRFLHALLASLYN
ncbi:hypothetical protein PHLCEN_2v4212 [Hermanssonia centrifuga]|uniref:Uncharacterized protein n=1 Tax=Hermanssonia centrifuga TaxID=98765 RepID=A0A2R6PYX2_9APHY|nr:hypothetical protein PHLCEN_2v4212 [Hermanssonia centrifuga]